MKTATRFAARQAIVTQITTWPDPTPLPTPRHLQRGFDPMIGEDDLRAARGLVLAVAVSLPLWLVLITVVWRWL